MAIKKFFVEKGPWSYVVVVAVVAVLVIAAVAIFGNKPEKVQAQTPVITQEEVDAAIEAGTAEIKAQVTSLTEMFATLREDFDVLMTLISKEKEAQQEQVQAVTVEQPVVEQPTRKAEIVYTIRQVGGGAEIIKDWNNEQAGVVSIPITKDLGWEDIHEKEGSPLYLVAISSDKGVVNFQGMDYVFDKGYVGVFITSEPLSIDVTTDWNGSAEDPKDRHYNVWSEMFVVADTLDIEEIQQRLLSEWIEEQGKDLGFSVDLSGKVSKMKFSDAVDLNAVNGPLFPDQLPQTSAGENTVIMTVSQVGAGSLIIKDWKDPEASAVMIPSEDKTNWQGILKKDDNPLYLVLISSDPGVVKFGNIEKTFKQGFVAAFITSQPESISLSTGWNEQSGHFNVWAEKFIIPEDEDIDEVLKQKLAEWKKAQGKSISFAILSDGSEYSK